MYFSHDYVYQFSQDDNANFHIDRAGKYCIAQRTMHTIHTLRARTIQRLITAGDDAPRLCAELLLAQALGCDRLALALRPDHTPTASQVAVFEALIDRRAKGEPLAYILGSKEFFGRDFIVSPATLIPRPDTECVVEAVLTACQNSGLRFVDIGTGSGCIGITLAAQRSDWQGCLLDISASALKVARANALKHGVADRVLLVRGDLLRLGLANAQLDIVVSNPAYVSATEYIQLNSTVREYEPRTALVPGPESDAHGWNHLRVLAAHAGRLLKPGGLCCVEHGAGQGAAVRHFFATQGDWQSIHTGHDLAGRERYCLCRRR